MRHVIATCPNTDPDQPGFLHIAIPGTFDPAAPTAWTPIPCWVPDSACHDPHPFIEHHGDTVAGFCRAVAFEAENPRNRTGPLIPPIQPSDSGSDAHSGEQAAASAAGPRMSSGSRMSSGAAL